MAIVNRTLDSSEQKKTLYVTANTVVNGTTLSVGLVPYPSTFIGGQLSCWGISGAPTVEVAVNRFIAGTGFTTWVLAKGTSNTPADFGVSGAGAFGTGASGMICIAQGSTLGILLANDVITVTVAGGTGAAAKSVFADIVIQPIVDIKTHFNTGI